MKHIRTASIVLLLFSISLILPGTAQPRLDIARQGTNIVISWAATNAPDFALQQSPVVPASNQWTAVPQVPTASTGRLHVVVAPTNPAAFFRLATNALDEPDDAFVDSNGDGIDGTVGQAIFVATTGSDTNPGTMAEPLRSIGAGITNAVSQGRKHVYVAQGLYTSPTLILANGISIYGGYNGTNWVRSDNARAELRVSNPTGVRALNLASSTTLDRLIVVGGDATGASASAYGIFAQNSPGLVVRHCTVEAGRGAAGSAGSDGGAGSSGSDGSLGNPGCEDSTFACSSCNQPQGGAGGTSPCGRNGGRGGNAGHSSSSGSTGSVGVGGTPGGPGTPPRQGGWNTPSTYWGANGLPGANGPHGAAAAPTYEASGYVATQGGNGTAGQPGNGGGGGGGGGGGERDCDSYGGGGGGGGAGGCGGGAGAGGLSGGGSFAIYLSASNARIEACTLRTSSGGNGGRGGTGGAGGWGGLGAKNASVPGAGNFYGGSGEQDDGSNGGRGGDGGAGGNGGHGGGGAGGPSIGIVNAAGSDPELQSVTFSLGPGGAAGPSSGNPGAIGRTAEIYR